MIVLSSSNSLECVLSGAVTTSQLPIVACYNDVSTGQDTPYVIDSQTNGTSAVTIASAPASGLPAITRHVGFLSISNTDSASATVTVRLREGATVKVLILTTLAVGDNLIFGADGFRVIDTDGNLKLS